MPVLTDSEEKKGDATPARFSWRHAVALCALLLAISACVSCWEFSSGRGFDHVVLFTMLTLLASPVLLLFRPQGLVGVLYVVSIYYTVLLVPLGVVLGLLSLFTWRSDTEPLISVFLEAEVKVFVARAILSVCLFVAAVTYRQRKPS